MSSGRNLKYVLLHIWVKTQNMLLWTLIIYKLEYMKSNKALAVFNFRNSLPDRATRSFADNPLWEKLCCSCDMLNVGAGRFMVSLALDVLPSFLPLGTSHLGPPDCRIYILIRYTINQNLQKEVTVAAYVNAKRQRLFRISMLRTLQLNLFYYQKNCIPCC